MYVKPPCTTHESHVRVPARVMTTSFLIHLPANAPWEDAKNGSGVCHPGTYPWRTQVVLES